MRLKATFAAVLLSTGAHASDMLSVLDAARQADPEYAAAQRSQQADRQALTQGRAALLPSLNASYSHLRNDNTVEGSQGNPDTDRTFDTQTTTVSLVQPLFRPETWYSYGQGKALANAGDARFASEQQSFLLRVAENYTNVLRSWDNLVASRAAEKAIGRQLDQTRERFEVGLVPITDVHEAQAVHDLARVNLIQAEADFAVARDELRAFTGEDLSSVTGLRADLPMPGPEPSSPQAWMDRAREANPELLAARYNADAARSAASQGLSRQLPSVDLVGQYQHVHNVNEDDTTSAVDPLFDRHGNSVGIQVNVPIFAGGGLNSQRLEASYRYQAAEEQYRLVYRDVGQSAQSLTRVVRANAQRVKARRQAVVSAQSALKATESGYEVGTRNAVDLLNAQRSFYQAERDYAFARYDYIISSLQLKAVAGMLSRQDIEEINGWLNPDLQVRLDTLDVAQGQSDANP